MWRRNAYKTQRRQTSKKSGYSVATRRIDIVLCGIAMQKCVPRETISSVGGFVTVVRGRNFVAGSSCDHFAVCSYSAVRHCFALTPAWRRIAFTLVPYRPARLR